MLKDRITRTINTYSMFKDCSKVTAALSGGADSVCLLRILQEICPQYGAELDAVHVNHCIRGKESDRDEEFCRRLCGELGIDFKSARYDVPKYARERKLSMEEAARQLRYAFFEECLRSGGKIATAHTASDNAETVLINLARGTGLKGLAGIPPVRDRFIRPLIEITRKDVEEYLDSINQDYVTDSTNLTLDYTRNKIRKIVIPALSEINSGFISSVSAETKIISEENEYIEMQAEKAYESCFRDGRLENLNRFPPVIVKRCVMRFLKKENIPLNRDRINAIFEIVQSGGKINVSDETYAVCRKNVLYISRGGNVHADISIPLEIGENFLFPGKKLTALENEKGQTLIDADKIKGTLILRNRRFGDKIKLAGKNFTSSVKKLMNESIPAYERRYIHFIEDEEGLIFAERLGVADRVKITEKTNRILSINIEETVEK